MIVSSANSKVKDMRAVRRCKDDRALLEGPHLVGEAVRAGLELEIVVATAAYLESAGARTLLGELPRRPLEIAPSILDEICDSDSPRGIVAVARLSQRELTEIPTPPRGVYLYADGLQDPGNVGAVARSGEGSGALGLLLGPGSAHPNHPRALRASAGSLLRLPASSVSGPDSVDRHLGTGTAWWGLAGSSPVSLFDLDRPDRLVLAVGSEAHGLSDPVRRRLDETVSIPLTGELESLNAAVAAGIALFELRRRTLG